MLEHAVHALAPWPSPANQRGPGTTPKLLAAEGLLMLCVLVHSQRVLAGAPACSGWEVLCQLLSDSSLAGTIGGGVGLLLL